MNKTNTQAAQFTSKLIGTIGNKSKFDVILCPPYTALEKVSDIVSGSKIKVGAQNVFL